MTRRENQVLKGNSALEFLLDNDANHLRSNLLLLAEAAMESEFFSGFRPHIRSDAVGSISKLIRDLEDAQVEAEQEKQGSRVRA